MGKDKRGRGKGRVEKGAERIHIIWSIRVFHVMLASKYTPRNLHLSTGFTLVDSRKMIK